MKKRLFWSLIFGLWQFGLLAQTGWNIIPSPTAENLFEITYHSFTASDWIMGANGTLYNSPDHGESWESMDSGTESDIKGQYGPAGFQDWIAGNSGTVLVSLDLGETWLDRSPGTNDDFNTIFSRGSGTAYVAGNNGIVYYSSDMGVTWENRSAPTDEHLNCGIGPTSGTTLHALVGGDNGVIFKTIDAGVNWTVSNSGTENRINGFGFGPTGVIFAVADEGIILKTINSGDSWTIIETPTNENLYSMDASGQNSGWLVAVGANGTILKTTDAGANWFLQVSPTEETLYSVLTATNSVHLAVGKNGIIIKTTDGGETVGIETFSNSSNQMFLEQNFPNPFRDITQITFTIVKSDDIKLEIFDVYGKKVQTLVNEYKSKGTYTIEFKVNYLSDGIYYYHLQSNHINITKKMLVMY